MNIQQGLLKNAKQTKSIENNKEIEYYLYLFLLVAFSPIVWLSLYFIGSNIFQCAIIILPCIIMFIFFLEIANETSVINNHLNELKA
jgi:hypothetical protein